MQPFIRRQNRQNSNEYPIRQCVLLIASDDQRDQQTVIHVIDHTFQQQILCLIHSIVRVIIIGLHYQHSQYTLLTSEDELTRNIHVDTENIGKSTFTHSCVSRIGRGGAYAPVQTDIRQLAEPLITHTSRFLTAHHQLLFHICITLNVESLNQLPSSFRQPHSVHCPPGSPHPAHITSSQSPSSLLSPTTPSTFYSRLKTHLFHKSFPPQSLLFLPD